MSFTTRTIGSVQSLQGCHDKSVQNLFLYLGYRCRKPLSLIQQPPATIPPLLNGLSNVHLASRTEPSTGLAYSFDDSLRSNSVLSHKLQTMPIVGSVPRSATSR